MAYVTLSSKAIGSTIKLKVNGSARNFIVVHQGKPSSVYDDSCNGTWLLMQDIYENRAWHSSNTNDYANSTIHSYLNSTFLNLGSPPRMRGKGLHHRADRGGSGITPAYAGKSKRRALPALSPGDHPRMCGEKTR